MPACYAAAAARAVLRLDPVQPVVFGPFRLRDAVNTQAIKVIRRARARRFNPVEHFTAAPPAIFNNCKALFVFNLHFSIPMRTNLKHYTDCIDINITVHRKDKSA